MASPGRRRLARVADPAPTADRGAKGVTAIGGVRKQFVPESAAIAKSATLREPREQLVFQNAFPIPPDFDPAVLVQRWENSSLLRPNIDAYSKGIHGFGHRFEPVIDLEAQDATTKVRDSIYAERLAAADDPMSALDGRDALVAEPTDAEVAARIDELRQEMRRQLIRATAFFKYCATGEGITSFKALRRRMSDEREIMGNAYWEARLDGMGRLARIGYVPSYTMLLMALRPEDEVEVEVSIPISDVGDIVAIDFKRFRRFQQVPSTRFGVGSGGGSISSPVGNAQTGFGSIFFKSWGDPRVISRSTGETFPSVDALLAADANDRPASELLHFQIHSPWSPYGLPRYHGALFLVAGQHKAEQVTYFYLLNNGVPETVIAVNGGTLTEVNKQEIADYFSKTFRGVQNVGRALVIEAESAVQKTISGSGQDGSKVKIDFHSLNEDHWKDGRFLDYGERNADVVGHQFGLSRFARGDVRDFNRATAQAATAHAEQSVYGPEREDFDEIVNVRVMPRIGVRLLRFKSNGPTLRDPTEVATNIQRLAPTGAFKKKELREMGSDVIGRQLEPLADDEGEQIAGAKAPAPAVAPGVPPNVPEKNAAVAPDASAAPADGEPPTD